MFRQKKLIPLLLLVAVIIGTGYYFYNKGPLNVRNSPAIQLTAPELYRQLTTDSTAMLKKYTGKVLAVDGFVSGISMNQQQQQVVLLKTATTGGFVNCTMESGEVKINDSVTIKGICSGIGEADTELGIPGDVYLIRCYKQK